MLYRFDVDRWIIHQLPPILRRTAIYAFLRVLLYPLKQLASIFLAYKENVDRQLAFNGFADMMQRFLNDIFFYPDGTIYITDVVDSAVELSFQEEGFSPVYMSFDDETPAASFYLASWPPGETVGQFVVHVPETLSEEEIATVRQWVEYYKFAGTMFTIETYE